MKRSKLFFGLSLLFGLFAVIFWILRFWYPNDINIFIPLTLNTLQLGFILNINDNE